MATPAWQNADGLQVKFPNYYRDPSNFANRVRTIKSFGSRKQLEIDIDLSLIPAGTTSFTSDLNNDGTLEGFNTGDIGLPANASVTDAVLVMTVAAAGGTSITVGTYRLDGTTVSATSIMTATEGVLANMNAAGKRIFGAGALLSASAGTAGVGANNVWVGITTAGTFTAGKGRLIISYIDVGAELASNT